MLTNIKIDSFAIISCLEIDITRGFTVITGQTGSGKSIIFDAIKFALGERIVNRDHVLNPNADTCSVVLTFDLAHYSQARKWLAKHELNVDQQLVVERILSRKRPSKFTINHQNVNAQMLQDLGQYLVHIHGQNTHLAAANQHFQRLCLDVLTQRQDLVDDVAQAYQHWARLEQQLKDLNNKQVSVQEFEMINYYLSELDELQPQAQDWQEINQQLTHVESINASGEHGQCLLELFCQPPNGLLLQLAKSIAILEQMPKNISHLDNAKLCLNDALVLCQEAEREVGQLQSGDIVDPQKLKMLEKRVEKYYELARKQHVKPEGLEGCHQSLRERHQLRLQFSQQCEQLKLALEDAIIAWRSLARELSCLRQDVADKLVPEMEKSMRNLGMTYAKVHVQLTQDERIPHAHGSDAICFLATTNPDHPMKPLNQVASGGELSRISLIMRKMMMLEGEAVTLVFDEAEAGVSGHVASSVGHLLKSLAQDCQVLCITHVPQVAALGDHHFSVRKIVDQGRTESSFSLLDRYGRIDELARMIGHKDVTTTARKQAEALLELGANRSEKELI